MSGKKLVELYGIRTEDIPVFVPIDARIASRLERRSQGDGQHYRHLPSISELEVMQRLILKIATLVDEETGKRLAVQSITARLADSGADATNRASKAFVAFATEIARRRTVENAVRQAHGKPTLTDAEVYGTLKNTKKIENEQDSESLEEESLAAFIPAPPQKNEIVSWKVYTKNPAYEYAVGADGKPIYENGKPKFRKKRGRKPQKA